MTTAAKGGDEGGGRGRLGSDGHNSRHQRELRKRNLREDEGFDFASKKPRLSSYDVAIAIPLLHNMDADDSDCPILLNTSDDVDADTAALLAELERIKIERTEETVRKERRKRQKREEDVVLKNQTRGKVKSTIHCINDIVIRNDFHRKFLAKYMK
eukprot:Gb_20064 [translate_table: standard]